MNVSRFVNPAEEGESIGGQNKFRSTRRWKLAPKETAYWIVKAMVQRCERSNRMAKSMREKIEAPKVKVPEGRGHAAAVEPGDTLGGSADTH